MIRNVCRRPCLQGPAAVDSTRGGVVSVYIVSVTVRDHDWVRDCTLKVSCRCISYVASAAEDIEGTGTSNDTELERMSTAPRRPSMRRRRAGRD
jgi:hypothetical protein